MHFLVIFVLASLRAGLAAAQGPAPTTVSQWIRQAEKDELHFENRRATTSASAALITCGYDMGNSLSPVVAPAGYTCPVNFRDEVWGFCTTQLTSGAHCYLPGACVDPSSCSGTCYFNRNTAMETITCSTSGANVQFCSTAMLTYAIGQSYAHIACGAKATTEHYYITPTQLEATGTTTATTATPTASSQTSSSLSSSSSSSSSVLVGSASTVTETAAASTSTDEAKAKTGSSTNVGAIVGGSVGGVALICLSAVAIVLIRRKRASGAIGPSDQEVAPTSQYPTAPSPYPTAPSPYSSAAPPYTSPMSQQGPFYGSDIAHQKVAWEAPVPGDPSSPVELPSAN